MRRFAGFAFTLMLFSLCLTGAAIGPRFAAGDGQFRGRLESPHWMGDDRGLGDRSAGDWFVVDYANGGLYEFPAGGGAAIVLGSVTPSASLGGGYQNPVITIDPGNNIYLRPTGTTAS